ncbi:MAG: methionine--tRNA ligase [Candidatus Pacebacteria bacterium]|nr:methionine--tRNA ligase [Candidatus Paceibacterota bacterium]
MSDNFYYLTTTLPYVNAEPHIGFGLELTEADVIARYQQMIGKKVIFNTGTDEHGQKIYQQAREQGLSPQEYTNHYSAKFARLKELLNVDYTNFIRTTDEHHIKAAQQFWQKVAVKGDIYKANYKIKYCVGCELAKTESELEKGRCPLHPNKELEVRQEENYFFRFSKYQDQLLALYKNNPEFIKPEGKQKEVTSFVQAGLKDFSISRLKEKMPWGIPVPGDQDHVMYVWFDALINYISTLGWPDDQAKFETYWPGVQLAGKDNLRQQAAMWQAMLLAAGLPPSKKILINGFISIEGQKMSKSLGNVISPEDMNQRYGAEASRYLLISLGVFGQDMDVSWEKLDTAYNAYLSNGLGNLCSRVAKLSQTSQVVYPKELTNQRFKPEFNQLMKNYQLTEALSWIDEQISQADQFLSKTKPWKQAGTKQKMSLIEAIDQIQLIAYHLEPFMPQTARQIHHHFQGQINSIDPLFPRVNSKKSEKQKTK